MLEERRGAEDGEAFPPGEDASREDEPLDDEETFPAGVESDEGERPGEQLEDGQPGMLEDPPRAD